MKRLFNYKKYSEDNSDLVSHFAGIDEAQLCDHYITYGHRELRGVPEARVSMDLDGMLFSDAGYIYLAGWCDRRVFSTLTVSLRIGYMTYDFADLDPCWYQRDDVSNVLGDYSNPAGYILLLSIPPEELVLAPNVSIYINGIKQREEPLIRFLSVDRFLNEALGAVASLATRPAGGTFDQALKLSEAFGEVWQSYLVTQSFVPVFENRPLKSCQQSIIITLHRKFDMLLVQLSELAKFLTTHDAEVIVVGNDLIAPEEMRARVTAFCQIHDISIRLILCSGNSGFSAGNNHGAKVARGDTLIFMNPDIFPPEGDAEQALAFLSSDPGDALHGAMLYYGDGMLMHSGMYSVRDLAFDAKRGKSCNLLRVEHFGKGLSHRVDDNQDGLDKALAGVRQDILLVSAALWKVSKAEFDAIGGLSTDYIFAYYEDADFCLRWRDSGREIVLDSTSRWLHLEGVGKETPPAVRSFMWLNRAFYSRRFETSPLVVDTAQDLQLL